MTPDRPGRWLYRFHSGETVVYHFAPRELEPGHPELCKVGEDEWGSPVPPVAIPLSVCLEIDENLGWGIWVERVGDLPAELKW